MMERRIYYEDTDAAGVVYYGKYLGFLEQGRTEYLRERGVSIGKLHEQGHLFAVMRVEIDYLKPAVLDDLIRVDTNVLETSNATFTMGQKVVRISDERLLAEGRVTMACIGPGGRAKRMPAELLKVLETETTLVKSDQP